MKKTPEKNLFVSQKKEPLPIMLKAGALRCWYCDGTIRNVMAGNVEIVRRIYVAVRDKYWNSVRPSIENLTLAVQQSSFRIEFDSRHVRKGIRFAWHAEINGNDDGALSFSMKGNALATFETNRIGFCVLHPLKECIGKRVTVEMADGSKETLRFPKIIGPWQPLKNIRAMYQKFGRGITSEVRFEGDTFETEDQRNWTDASFKTYCPPLKNNIPFQIKNGHAVSQNVVLRVKTHGRIKDKISESRVINVGFSIRSGMLPEIGTVISDQEKIPENKTLQLVHRCNFSHLRMNIIFDSSRISQTKKTAADYSKLLNAPLELALFFRKEKHQFDHDLQTMQKLFEGPSLLVKRVLVFRKGEKVTSGKTVNTVVEVLNKCAPKARIITGTNGYFVEINRNPPTVNRCDGICYSLNPQVHTFDDASIIDNLEGQPYTVLTAQKLFPEKDVFVTPVTLRPRLVPELPQKYHGADERQKTLLGAAWTLGSIIRLSEAGAKGITYFETSGDCGLMAADGRNVFPLYHVFTDIGEFAGGTMRVYQPETRRTVEACVVEKDGRKRWLAANMTPEKKEVVIHDLPDTVLVKKPDHATVGKAGGKPGEFRISRNKKSKTKLGKLPVTLGPYEIIRIDEPV
jgi:D-apionolactonase